MFLMQSIQRIQEMIFKVKTVFVRRWRHLAAESGTTYRAQRLYSTQRLNMNDSRQNWNQKSKMSDFLVLHGGGFCAFFKKSNCPGCNHWVKIRREKKKMVAQRDKSQFKMGHRLHFHYFPPPQKITSAQQLFFYNRVKSLKTQK